MPRYNEPPTAGEQEEMCSVSPQEAILGAIVEERKRQNAKWGEQHHGEWYWLCVLMEELGEAAKATIADTLALSCCVAPNSTSRRCVAYSAISATQRTIDDSKYRKELIQVAACAVAAIEDSDWQEERR